MPKKITPLIILLLASVTMQSQDYISLGESSFSKYFVESRLQFGPGREREDIGQFNIDLGIGAQFSYVPNHWGWYAGVTYVDTKGNKDKYLGFQGGVVYRLLNNNHKIDIQLYSGLACGLMNLFNEYRLSKKQGLDAGIRFAPGSKAGRSPFAWTSATLGITNYWDRPFVTFCFSVDITAALTLMTLVFEEIK